MTNLINGDCLIEMDKLIEQGVKVDAIITDPPYGVNFKNDFFDDSKENVFSKNEDWLKRMFNILKENSHCYIFVPTKEIHCWITTSIKVGFLFKNILSSECKYSNPLKNNFKFDKQYILFLSKGKSKKLNEINIQKTSEAWLKDKRNKKPKEFTYQYSSDFNKFSTKLSKLLHPNEKSIDFIETLIKLSSNKGETILDPFMGSGTTGIACKNLNRKFIGIELDKDYFYIAKKRIEND